MTFILLVACTKLQEWGENEFVAVPNTLNTSSSSPSHQVNFPSLTSINVPIVLRKSFPKIIGVTSFSSISRIIKSTGKMNFLTLISKSSTIPCGKQRVLFASGESYYYYSCCCCCCCCCCIMKENWTTLKNNNFVPIVIIYLPSKIK